MGSQTWSTKEVGNTTLDSRTAPKMGKISKLQQHTCAMVKIIFDGHFPRLDLFGGVNDVP